MKEKTLYEKRFSAKGPGGKGRVYAHAQLSSYAGQEPRFSLTNDSGCAHKQILEVMPQLRIFANLHLCDRHGAPMHCLENAVFHLRNNDPERLAHHLGIDEERAKEWMLSKHWDWSALTNDKARDEVVADLEGEARSVEAFLERMRQKKQMSLHDKKYLPFTFAYELEQMFPARFKDYDPAKSWGYGYNLRDVQVKVRTSRSARWLLSASDGDDGWGKHRVVKREAEDVLSAIRDSIRNPRPILDRSLQIAQRAHMGEFIETLRHGWQARADMAVKIMEGYEGDNDEFSSIDEELREEEEWDPAEQLLMRFSDGEIVEAEKFWDSGYLPEVDLGGKCYHVAQDKEEAGEAAVRRWRDMAQDDPIEFACLIGEKTLVAWAMGRKAGPGTYSAVSFEDWLDGAVMDNPQEEFAGYDGEQVDVEISEALGIELGWNGGEEGWVECVGYRSN